VAGWRGGCRLSIAALSLACSLLVATFYWQVSAGSGGVREQDGGAERAMPASPVFHADKSALQPALPRDLSPLFDRPLFSQTRRPPAEPDTPPATEPAAATPPEFVLRGVIVSPQSRRALLQTSGDGKLSRVREGETVEGWEVTAISPRKVTLRQAENVIEIRLRQDRQQQ
jgi:hypothetical protein